MYTYTTIIIIIAKNTIIHKLFIKNIHKLISSFNSSLFFGSGFVGCDGELLSPKPYEPSAKFYDPSPKPYEPSAKSYDPSPKPCKKKVESGDASSEIDSGVIFGGISSDKFENS